MRVSVLAFTVALLLAGQSLSVSSCHGQTATQGNPPKVAPVGPASTPPVFSPDQREKIREIVREETSSWKSFVVVLPAILVALFGIILWQSVGGLKKRAKSHITEIAKCLEQANKIVAELQTIRDSAAGQAEEYPAEMKRRVEKVLADLGKTLTHRPRYVLTQGGTTVEPSWEFDLVLLFTIKGDSSMRGLLRTSGGSKFNSLREEEKEWQECTITLNEDKWISLERRLTGTLAGNTQNFKGKPGSAPKIIKENTAMVWEGQWSGYSAGGVPGALIVYLD